MGLFGSWFCGMFFVIVRRMVKNCVATMMTMKTPKISVGSEAKDESRIVWDSGTPRTCEESISEATA